MGEPPFEIVLTGRFTPDQVRATWQSTGERRREAAIEVLIAAAWKQRVGEAAARGRVLFPGPLCRLVRWAVGDGQLQLTLGPTDYRDFLGTNVANLAAIQARHPSDWHAYLADPLAVCGVLVSADGWLLVMRRGERVAEYPGCYHVVGGHITPEHDDGIGGISPFLAWQDEIVEETGLQAAEVEQLTCLGLIRNRATAKPELVFAARMALDRAAVEARLASLGDRPEDAGWTWLNDDAAAIQAFLTRQAARIAPAGAACLTVYAHARPPAMMT